MKYLKDPETGKKSVTLTVFVTGFIVCLTKLLLSDVSVGSLKLGPFSGGDFAAACGALGAIYWARRNMGGPSA